MGIHALYTAASGMDAQLRNIDVIANNVANINTEGYRRDRINFSDLFYRKHALAGSAGIGDQPRPSGIHIGHGVEVVSTEKVFRPGGTIQTGNPFHVNIMDAGNHFFRVQYGDGQVAYSRAGNFVLNGQGQFVTPSGHPLDTDAVVPPEYLNVTISEDGIVQARTEEGQPSVQIGEITVTRFVNPAGLEPMGNNLFVRTASSGEAVDVVPGSGRGVTLLQGAVEGSNVNAITELIQLIQAQRAYEINSNVIETADEALQIANNLRG